MPEAGFFAQKRGSPSSLALVILLHAALLAAVIMIRGPAFQRIIHPPITVRLIHADPDPLPDPPPAPPERPLRQPTQIDRTPPIVDIGPVGPPVDSTWHPPVIADAGGDAVVPPIHSDPPAPPVRRRAELDPRFAGALQPPYPAAEQRAQRGGRVQVRVTIAPSGRVSAIVRLTATSDAFWRVTEQQALNHWRFRPATVDGRPVEDSKVMTLVFRIEDAG